MLDRIIEQAREEKVFSREDTPTEQRVRAAFLYHAGLSHRRVEEVQLTAERTSNYRTVCLLCDDTRVMP